MTDKQKEFLTKLKALLSEYNMSINGNYEGDTHGIDREYLTIEEYIPRTAKEYGKYDAFFTIEGSTTIDEHNINI